MTPDRDGSDRRRWDIHLIDLYVAPVRRGRYSPLELVRKTQTTLGEPIVGRRQVYRWANEEYPKTKLVARTRRMLADYVGKDVRPPEEGV